MQDAPVLTTINEQIDWVLARKDVPCRTST